MRLRCYNYVNVRMLYANNKYAHILHFNSLLFLMAFQEFLY